jgi:hypothetical protein
MLETASRQRGCRSHDLPRDGAKITEGNRGPAASGRFGGLGTFAAYESAGQYEHWNGKGTHGSLDGRSVLL